MKKLVVLTGAGMSAESGLKTFRDSDGLWENYNVMEVASIEGWYRNPELIQTFYNDRRRQLLSATPNNGHLGLVDLEKHFDVHIITQNVDNLHEQAGSTKVLHLHGELMKARSEGDPNYVVQLTPDHFEMNMGDKCPKGFQMRPHIVWFGEAVPAMDEAIPLTQDADIVVVIGTSLNVYPAAGLLNYANPGTPIYLIDPNPASVESHVHIIQAGASEGVKQLKEELNV